MIEIPTFEIKEWMNERTNEVLLAKERTNEQTNEWTA